MALFYQRPENEPEYARPIDRERLISDPIDFANLGLWEAS